MRNLLLKTLFLAGSMAAAWPAGATPVVLVEAEGFLRPGGWALDQQFMDQMGSPYLLAHGLGVPVADATTTVEFPAPAAYRVWVRTRDWVAPWGAPGAPGRFQVQIDGKPLDKVFGTVGAEWHWEDGGTVQIAKTSVELALHDLTGFEGRCDAVLFAADPDFCPPNEGEAMAAFRREALSKPKPPKEAGEYDLVVVGGGIAGVCASLAAARLDVRVALIQDRPVLGGNNSSEVRVWLGGKTNFEPYPRIGGIVAELEPARRAHPGTADMYEDDKREALVQAEPNIALFLSCRANGVEMDGTRIRGVIAQNIVTGERLRFGARWVVDSTGDGCIGYLAGADFDMTLKGHMGRSNLWAVENTGAPAPFPRCPWAADLSDKPFPEEIEQLGQWFWESGFDHDPIAKSEYIRDTNFRGMYGAWDALKNARKKYPNHRLAWAAYIAGKRESRRLLGDVILEREDVLKGKAWPDGVVPSTWSIDLHLPDPNYVKGFEGDAFLSKADFEHFDTPYWVPYRCLYSRNVPNLFMAGRDVSVTHEALGTVRVMRTTGMMGEVVGIAAGVCKSKNVDPRGVYETHLPEFLELVRKGVGKPPAGAPDWLESAGPNLAAEARVSVSSHKDAQAYPFEKIHDNEALPRDNSERWISNDKPPHHVEFAWSEPRTVDAARIVSGYVSDGGRPGDPITDFSLQAWAGGKWTDIPGAAATGNRSVDWATRFEPVETQKVRLAITATPGGYARLWEVALYETQGASAAPEKED